MAARQHEAELVGEKGPMRVSDVEEPRPGHRHPRRPHTLICVLLWVVTWVCWHADRALQRWRIAGAGGERAPLPYFRDQRPDAEPAREPAERSLVRRVEPRQSQQQNRARPMAEEQI